jgi:hypothetical protein
MYRSKIALTVSACVLTVNGAVAAVIRHDVPAENYLAEEADFPAVFPLYEIGVHKDCVGTLIAPGWGITAAHCFEDMFPGFNGVLEGGKPLALENEGHLINVAGQTTRITSIIPAPGLGRVMISANADGTLSLDLSEANVTGDVILLKFSTEIVDVAPIPLYGGRDEVGQTITLLGWGSFGTGDVGLVEVVNDGTFRKTENVVDLAEGPVLSFLFDDPATGMALDLEGVNGPGDSGGPALMRDGDSWVLAGISSYGEYPDGMNAPQGQYGWREFYPRISEIKPWIDSVIAAK